MRKRTLVIGDIHGGLKGLIQVLDRANIKLYDSLIFLGDYVDGWSESAELIDYLIELDKKHPCIFIKGNHDIWCEKWLRTRESNPTWLLHSGKLTIDSYKDADDYKKFKHLRFFESMPLYHITEENDLFIHAGYTSMHGPRQEFHQSNYNWDRTLWEMAIVMDTRIEKHSILFPKRLKLFREIYIGHTPTLDYNQDKPMKACNVWNIDTGAAFSGKLSCMDIETKEIFQSDKLLSLYPGENGRNRNR